MHGNVCRPSWICQGLLIGNHRSVYLLDEEKNGYVAASDQIVIFSVPDAWNGDQI